MSCCQKSDSTQKMGSGEQEIWGAMKEYYGKEVKSKEDIQTEVNCCGLDSAMPPHLREALGQVHQEVTDRYYGCGLVIPEVLEGCSVLDLGSGTGRDCFAVSKVVGPKGRVVGIDMTEEQLAIARKHIDYHTNKFGYSQPNVEFVFGHIEKLAEAGLKDNTFDIIISNCVVNLSPDKTSVLREAFRVLKDGGELYFSDIYADTHLSTEIRQHKVLWGQCVAGALHWQDLYQIAQKVGFSKPRLVTASPVDVSRFSHVLGDAKFVTATYRLFKLPKATEAPCLATYKGGIWGYPDKLEFDRAVTFKKDTALAIDGELAAILSSSRFNQFFNFSDSGAVTAVTPDPKVDPFLKKEAKAKCCSGSCS